MKRFLSVLLTLALLLSMVTVSAMAEGEAPITITVYDAAANYHGIQKGWFAKVVKDRFNIELDIIAPQVAGQEIYATRAEEGNLGDIVIVDKSEFPNLVKAGLVRPIDEIAGCENLMRFKDQIDHYNKGLTGEDGKYYGIPSEMADTSPTSLTDDVVPDSPMIRWDLYKAIGCPEIKDLDDFVDVLAQIHEIHKTTDAGDPCYSVTLWADWDNNDDMSGPANVTHITPWYGEKMKRSALLQADGKTFLKVYDRAGAYYKATRFLNKLYQRGLVDPDSGSQDWNSVMNKWINGQADLLWYNWSTGFTNNNKDADGVPLKSKGMTYFFVPITDSKYYAEADAYYGTARMFGIGSKVEGEKYDLLLKFLDWYASPEGMTFQHVGIEGLNYTKNEDGTFVQFHDNALAANEPVPEEYVGEDGVVGFSDGNNAINQWIGGAICVNPDNGERFASKFWSSYKAKEKEEDITKTEWQEHFGAENAVDYMLKHGMLEPSPNVGFAPPMDEGELKSLRPEINGKLCEYTWKAIFAKDDAEFESLWDEMITTLDGFDYDKLFENDVAVYTKEVEMKQAALGN